MRPLHRSDMEHVLAYTTDVWPSTAGASLLITGGTGFFGCWMLESLLFANDELNLGVRVEVLTRDAEAFRRKSPHVANHPALTLVEGDVRSFTPERPDYKYIVHLATETDEIGRAHV